MWSVGGSPSMVVARAKKNLPAGPMPSRREIALSLARARFTTRANLPVNDPIDRR